VSGLQVAEKPQILTCSERSPAIDVPASTQKFNQSKLFEGGRQGTIVEDNKACCSKM